MVLTRNAQSQASRGQNPRTRATPTTTNRSTSSSNTPAERRTTNSKKPPAKRKRSKNTQPIANDQIEPNGATSSSENPENLEDNIVDPLVSTLIPPKSKGTFVSRFPGLELEDFEEHLDDWTIIDLQEAIAKQGSKSTKAASEIKSLVRSIRLEYEKRMLMAALMGGVPEAVVWKLVGEGGKYAHANPWIRFLAFCVLALQEKLPPRGDKEAWNARNTKMSEIWNGLTDDEKKIFRDPYFFALAGLPNLALDSTDSNDDDDDDEEMFGFRHLDSSIPAPKVHELSEEDRLTFQPLFDRLVDAEKLHLCHGQPDRTQSIAKLQQKSLAELRKAHHNFAVVCQRFHVSYYLTAASCGGVEGWSQVFSNNSQFALWARNEVKLPIKFSTYVHGKDSAKEIEAKPQQPSDQRKTRLGHMLNALMEAHVPGQIFPKLQDPAAEIKRRGWAIRLNRKAGSLLTAEELSKGHRLAPDRVVQNWIKDIELDRFEILSLPNGQHQPLEPEHTPTRKRKTLSKGQDKKRSKKRKINEASSNSMANTLPQRPRSSNRDLSLGDRHHDQLSRDQPQAIQPSHDREIEDAAVYVADLRKQARRRRKHDHRSTKKQYVNDRADQHEGPSRKKSKRPSEHNVIRLNSPPPRFSAREDESHTQHPHHPKSSHRPGLAKNRNDHQFQTHHNHRDQGSDDENESNADSGVDLEEPQVQYRRAAVISHRQAHHLRDSGDEE